ncbi:MAG: hypothetical protein ACI4RD_06210 [Kiritimatiellia bacterium]
MKKSLVLLAVRCLALFTVLAAFGAPAAPAPAAPAPAATPTTTNAVPRATNSNQTVRVHRGCRPKRPVRRGGMSIRHRYRTIREKPNP